MEMFKMDFENWSTFSQVMIMNQMSLLLHAEWSLYRNQWNLELRNFISNIGSISSWDKQVSLC